MPRSAEYFTFSPKKEEFETWKRFCQLNDKRLPENPTAIEVFRSMYKLARKNRTETGEEAVVEIEASHAFDSEPAGKFDGQNQQVPVVTNAELPSSPATEIPKTQVQPTLLSWNQDFMQRRLAHQEAVLALEEKKFNWRVDAFDRRMNFESERLGLAREIVNMKKHRNELEEKIILSQHGSRSDEVLCNYCAKRHSNSGCPQLIKDREKWGTWEGKPKVIDVTPSLLSDLSDRR